MPIDLTPEQLDELENLVLSARTTSQRYATEGIELWLSSYDPNKTSNQEVQHIAVLDLVTMLTLIAMARKVAELKAQK